MYIQQIIQICWHMHVTDTCILKKMLFFIHFGLFIFERNKINFNWSTKYLHLFERYILFRSTQNVCLIKSLLFIVFSCLSQLALCLNHHQSAHFFALFVCTQHIVCIYINYAYNRWLSGTVIRHCHILSRVSTQAEAKAVQLNKI